MTAKKIKWGELTVAEATEQFEKKFGMKCKIYRNKDKAIGLGVGFEKRGGKVLKEALKEAYCKINSIVFRTIILRHPDCPKDIKKMDKIIEEL